MDISKISDSGSGYQFLQNSDSGSGYRFTNSGPNSAFSFGVPSNFSQQKSPTANIIGLYFLGTIVPRKYTMPTISAVGLFCCNKFEETPNEN